MWQKCRGGSKPSEGTMVRKCYITEKFFINPEEHGFYSCQYCDFKGYLAHEFMDVTDLVKPHETVALLYVCTTCQSEGK